MPHSQSRAASLLYQFQIILHFHFVYSMIWNQYHTIAIQKKFKQNYKQYKKHKLWGRCPRPLGSPASLSESEREAERTISRFAPICLSFCWIAIISALSRLFVLFKKINLPALNIRLLNRRKSFPVLGKKSNYAARHLYSLC